MYDKKKHFEKELSAKNKFHSVAPRMVLIKIMMFGTRTCKIGRPTAGRQYIVDT